MSFFFPDPAPTDIYTLSLHDALPISPLALFNAPSNIFVAGFIGAPNMNFIPGVVRGSVDGGVDRTDRKSTRLNSSHRCISYAVFCLKKKKKKTIFTTHTTIKTLSHIL